MMPIPPAMNMYRGDPPSGMLLWVCTTGRGFELPRPFRCFYFRRSFFSRRLTLLATGVISAIGIAVVGTDFVLGRGRLRIESFVPSRTGVLTGAGVPAWMKSSGRRNRGNLVGEICPVLGSLERVLTKGLRDKSLDAFADFVRERVGFVFDMARRNGDRPFPGKQPSASNHLVPDNRERVDIAGWGRTVADACSGDKYSAVPITIPAFVNVASFRIRTIPKSVNLAVPSFVTRILLGLMSRCMTPAACACPSARGWPPESPALVPVATFRICG